MNKAIIVFAPFLVAAVIPWNSSGQTINCPPGMVQGSTKCEWKEICPDGTPTLNGECQAQVTGPLVPAPAPPTIPIPATACPNGQTSVNGICTPVVKATKCPDGRVPIKGVCSGPVRDCERRTAFISGDASKEGAGRRVLLVGGDTLRLFERYTSDVKGMKKKLDMDELNILFYENGKRINLQGGDNVKMNMGQMLSGMTMEQVWKRKLKGRSAGELPNPVAEARALKADLICGTRN